MEVHPTPEPESSAMRALAIALLILPLMGSVPELPLTETVAQGAVPDPPPLSSEGTLPAFRSEAEFRSFLRTYQAADGRSRRLEGAVAMDAVGVQEAPATAPAASESVTNVQHAGVDEGGIVKVHGDHLIILRRGRLFTVAIGDEELRPVSMSDAFGPDVDPGHAWYDELIVHQDQVVVVGYSYRRGGTEVGLFRIHPDGTLSHRSTYQLRSADYYSSRNYAARLVGSRLVFYAPVPMPFYGRTPEEMLPAFRRWEDGPEGGSFRRILPATRIHHAGLDPRQGPYVLHTVTTCDLAQRELRCDASAVLGPWGRVFYVSPGAVYVWTSHPPRGPGAQGGNGMLYRMPLDGSAPGALGVSGNPVDQFSFLEGGDGHLNVLVRSAGSGDGMWGAERSRGEVALLRIPLASFSDGRRSAPSSRYRSLPTPSGGPFQNRFVGDHLLYGTGSGWGRASDHRAGRGVYVVPIRRGVADWVPLEHGVDRIEALGRDAVVVGSGGSDLHFTSLRLGRRPGVAHRFVQSDAAQGELRSHGFFYRADDGDSGILGLPVREAGRPGVVHLREGSASILLLRNVEGHLTPLGHLHAASGGRLDDACRASCVDWYGNARPLFLRGRILALLGYELVEGVEEPGGIRELRRVDFSPSALARAPWR